MIKYIFLINLHSFSNFIINNLFFFSNLDNKYFTYFLILITMEIVKN